MYSSSFPCADCVSPENKIFKPYIALEHLKILDLILILINCRKQASLGEIAGHNTKKIGSVNQSSRHPTPASAFFCRYDQRTFNILE